MPRNLRRFAILSLLTAPLSAGAATYQVGPTRPFANLQAVAGLLDAGDLVLVDGNQTYPGGVVFNNDGDPGNPIVIRGVRVNNLRPHIQGGVDGVKFVGNHYVFEGFEVTGGDEPRALPPRRRRDHPRHASSTTARATASWARTRTRASLTLEYVEVHHCGGGDSSHQIYMATDETAHPGARLPHAATATSTTATAATTSSRAPSATRSTTTGSRARCTTSWS